MNQAVAQPVKASGGLRTFERYLSVWVALCMVAGVVIDRLIPAAITGLRSIEVGSQINAPITLQVYFNAGLAYSIMKWLKVEHAVAAPGALIGASNLF